MRFRGGVTITVERGVPGGHDAYGDPIVTEMTTHVIEECAVAPRAASESDARGRAGTIVGLTLYAPAGSDILRTDRIIIPDGVPNTGRYEVEGEPAEWTSPTSGLAKGMQVALRRAAG